MQVCLATGLAAAAYFLWRMFSGPREAVIVGNCIVYRLQGGDPLLTGLVYLAATVIPLMASSHRSIFALGAIIFLGCVVAYAFYWDAFLSVWCFFAAAASVVILGHFELARPTALRARL